MKTRTIVIWVLVLIVTDQLIKVIINAYFGELRFEIVPSLLDFQPTFNKKHSYVNFLLSKHFNIDVGLLPHVILYLVIGTLIFVYFFYFKNKIHSYIKLLDMSIIFLVSAVSCTLIGNLIWEKGVLDYIYLKPLFVFDLKDMYGDIFIILFLSYAIKNWSELKPINTRDVFSYAKNRLRGVR